MASRPSVVGPESGPEKPFPYQMEGKVIAGFGRGSKELGIPTANLPVDDSTVGAWIADVPSGVYYGYASLALPASHPDKSSSSPTTSSSAASSPPTSTPAPDFHVFPMVMSIGYNPFYKNTVRSAEVHILHRFAADFYDSPMRLLILGFIREEKDYSSLDALVDDINFDCDVAKNSLARPAWAPPRGVVVGAKDENLDGALDISSLTRPL